MNKTDDHNRTKKEKFGKKCNGLKKKKKMDWKRKSRVQALDSIDRNYFK